MILSKQNINFYGYILNNCSSKKEILKYIMKRLVGIDAKFNEDIIINSNGFNINCGRIMENCKTASEVFEDEVSKIIEKESSGICIDIGANIGKHSLQMSKNAVMVYAFEPIPSNVKLLEDNKERNGMDNIKVMPYALSDKNGHLNIKYDELHPAKSSVIIDAKIIQVVESYTLDYILKGYTKIKLIKIDVEGYELNVIRGAKEIIESNKPLILFEAWNFGSALNVALELPKGYAIHQIDEFNYCARYEQ